MFEVTMPVSGTYEQLGAFLQKLERSSHFLIVQGIALRTRASDGGADLDLKLQVYFRSDESAASAGPGRRKI
jgi:hypothetical protein